MESVEHILSGQLNAKPIMGVKMHKKITAMCVIISFIFHYYYYYYYHNHLYLSRHSQQKTTFQIASSYNQQNVIILFFS